jgi:hypothetical protein
MKINELATAADVRAQANLDRLFRQEQFGDGSDWYHRVVIPAIQQAIALENPFALVYTQKATHLLMKQVLTDRGFRVGPASTTQQIIFHWDKESE